MDSEYLNNKKSKRKEIDQNNLFYTKLEILEKTPVKVPKGEVWKVIAYFTSQDIPSRDVLIRLLTYYDQICKGSNVPELSKDLVLDFSSLTNPPLTFIDKSIPFFLIENEILESLSIPGWYLVLHYEILPEGVSKEAEYWRRNF